MGRFEWYGGVKKGAWNTAVYLACLSPNRWRVIDNFASTIQEIELALVCRLASLVQRPKNAMDSRFLVHEFEALSAIMLC